MKKVEFILLKTEEEYRQEFLTIYVDKKFAIDDIPVMFVEDDFDHIFREQAAGGGYEFSKRRAKRMHFMKALLSDDFGSELMHEIETGNIAIFCEDLECVMYLRARVGSGRLQVGTFFDFGRDHAKMLNKQKKKCVPITLQAIKENLL